MMQITKYMINVLVLARRGHQSQVTDQFMTKFRDRMATIGKLAFRLNKAVGEEVISGDLQAVCIPPDTRFDPTTMDDTYAKEPHANNTGLVLCTCGLGLSRYVKVEGTFILLKPKIILDSLLEENARF